MKNFKLAKPLLPLFLLLAFSLQPVWSTATEKPGGYYFSATVSGNLDDITTKVKDVLQKNGFGVITEIDMNEKLNSALDKNLKPYKILGVCDPASAFEAMMVEENIGLLLPCKVIIRETSEGVYQVASVNPEVLMRTVNNKKLDKVSNDVTVRLKKAIDKLR